MSAYFATCPKGLEYLLRDELAALGALDAREALAGVYFSGDLALAYRACLWSRLASRILLPLAEFPAADEQALYQGVYALDWSQQLTASGTLAVEAVTGKSQLTHSRFIAQRVKDAIVDQFRERSGSRPGVDTAQPDLRLHLHLRQDQATLSLDLAGQPLHRRGWRIAQGEAPLKENLAAAILLRAGWPAIYADGGALLDPMCGSGSLLIEAAWMAADVAPGLHRQHYGFTAWPGHDTAQWQELRAEAQQRAEQGLRALRCCFFGSDADPSMIETAKRNAQQAGVAGFIQLVRRRCEQLTRPEGYANGLVVTNPPYGERLGEREQLMPLYSELGMRLRRHFGGWRAAVLAGDAELGQALRLQPEKRYAFYNGALATPLLTFTLDARSEQQRPPKPLSEGAQMLANRLEKNTRHRRKRLEREGIYAWRAYDQDLPEYASAIDVYTDTEGQRWLHVQEYRAPASIPEPLAQARLAETVRAAARSFEVPHERIAVKTRQRGKGGAKYGRFDHRGRFIEVAEGGLRFLVNLFDYLDTGLFLDHRPLRSLLRERAGGGRFLNLFCYTGSASVYAAAGGARETVSVDLSATYLDWASRNLALNGFRGRLHQLVQADALSFLRQGRDRFDLIYVDTPTFSNSKRAEDFDVQRDHVALLLACRERLSDRGQILFSNNYRRFRLDREALEEHFRIQDESAASLPFDFARRPDIHGCWQLTPRAPLPVPDPWSGTRLKR